MAHALDSYVIRGKYYFWKTILSIDVFVGVTHNIPLLRDIITEERFVKGDISTKYLPQVYPEGFKGKQLKDTERESLVALAACVAVKSALRDRSFKQQTNVTTPNDYKFEVKINDFKRNLTVKPTEKNGNKQFEVCLTFF